MNPPATASARLFLGLWPDDEVRERIERWRDTAQWNAAAALVAPERLHLTLHFIGNVAAPRVAALRTELHVPAGTCDLRLDDAAVWPNGIAALTPLATPAALVRLHNALAVALHSNGLPVQERPWRPHVTLARKAQGTRLPPPPAIVWSMDASYVLMRSMPDGRYELVHRYDR